MDTLSPEDRSRLMALVKGKDTTPELLVRKLVFSLGYRYRLHAKELPGHPDLVFRSRGKVIFVHGCFWHRHSDPSCRLSRLPQTRMDYWVPKFQKNQLRDDRVLAQLEGLGWQVLVVWECELRDPVAVKAKLKRFLDLPRSQ